MIIDERFIECIRICIRKRKLHLKIKQLGYELEEFVHEVVAQAFIADSARIRDNKPSIKDCYTYGTVADNQLTWTLAGIIGKRSKYWKLKKQLADTSLSSPSVNEQEVVDSKEYVDFVLNLDILNDQEKQVMRVRYVQGLSLREATSIMPVSHERVRLIEKMAIKKLQKFYQCEAK
jgi:RNA polymerase sigma factor (sigma-70 family)